MNRISKSTVDKENIHKNMNKKGESQSKRVSLVKPIGP